MKVAIITDTHYGARKGSKHLHDYFEMFYRDIFFPSLEEHKIDTIIHMGDIFDSRKAIDLQSLSGQRKLYLSLLRNIKFMPLLEIMIVIIKILTMSILQNFY